MKKILSLLLLFCFFWCNVAFAKILILECNVGNSQTTFHIDTSNQTWIQEGTRRFETPQIARIYSSKIFMHVEIWLANEERNYFNNSYNDNSDYEVSTIMYDIDRYSEKIRGQSFIMTKNNFINIYFKNLKKNINSPNLYVDLMGHGKENEGKGYHYQELTPGSCDIAEKSF